MNRPIHFEILADDPVRVGQFYGDVFGWSTAEWGGGEQGYWLVTTGPSETPGINGGMMKRHFPQGVINTIEVADVEATVSAVEESGGKKVHGPEVVPGVGLHAYCSDPEGTIFGVLQPDK